MEKSKLLPVEEMRDLLKSMTPKQVEEYCMSYTKEEAEIMLNRFGVKTRPTNNLQE